MRSFKIFLQFLRRDAYIVLRRIKNYIINYVFVYPALYTIAFGFLLPLTSMGGDKIELATRMFVGSAILFLQIIVFVVNVEFIRDLENDKFINYQLSILPSRLVILERLVFTTLFCFVLVLPYFPLAKLLIHTFADVDVFDTQHARIGATMLCLFLGSALCAALNILAVCFLSSSRQLPKFWVRVFSPLVVLGGHMVPWIVMKKFSPVLGYAVLLNPMLYITEGLRQAIIGGPIFFSLALCVSVLSGVITLFSVMAIHFFKKKVDAL